MTEIQNVSFCFMLLQTANMQGVTMTTVDVSFKYAVPPGERQVQALAAAREVYGIRALRFDEQKQIVRVEYDASRLNEAVVESLLRQAGLDITERLVLA